MSTVEDHPTGEFDDDTASSQAGSATFRRLLQTHAGDRGDEVVPVVRADILGVLRDPSVVATGVIGGAFRAFVAPDAQ